MRSEEAKSRKKERKAEGKRKEGEIPLSWDSLVPHPFAIFLSPAFFLLDVEGQVSNDSSSVEAEP